MTPVILQNNFAMLILVKDSSLQMRCSIYLSITCVKGNIKMIFFAFVADLMINSI